MVEVRVLGPVTIVSDDGREWHLGTTREAAVLADLVVHAGEVVPVDRLVDDVWRGDPPPSATSTVQTYVKNLRRLIDPERGGRAPEQILVTARPGYLLRSAGDLVDAGKAVRLVEEGRRALEAGDEHGAADRLREATRLWHGRPFGELAGESYLLAEATRLNELFVVATEERVEAELRLGLHGVLCGELETVVGAYPYRERLWGQLMLALYRSGRQTDALRSYQRLRGTLADEIGIEPGEALRALETAILRHDPTLDWQPRPPTLTAAGGPAAHRAARRRESSRAAGRTLQSLPLALTRFVGRARERAELHDLLSGGTRLLTLTGVGGVGKTRLALETASDVADRYLEGLRLFEFAPVSRGDDVLSALAAAFGIYAKPGSDGNAVAELLCGHLSTRHLLLVFDNCEHVIEAVAPIVTAIVEDCAHVTILATSREPLRVPGEVVFAVPPLQLPDLARASTADIIGADAVVLFCDRARDARSDLRSTALDLPAVVRICGRLDGIPLALELAAARFRTLTLSQIADHLDQCLQLLVAGARTATPRQQTLKGALDWSYDLLPSTEQAGLRQLSVFPGTFDLDAARCVVAGDVVDSRSQAAPLAALELISQLVDKSLVVADLSSPAARYRLLEPVRQYAAEKLASAGETVGARRRHRDHFTARALCSDAPPDRVNTGPAGLADFDNYRAALEWSWEHGDIEASLILIAPQTHARIDNRDLRVRQWLETILAEPEPSTHPARAQALVTLALIVQESAQPDPRRSRQLMADAMAVAGRLRDPTVTACIQFKSAELHLAWGDSSQARALLTGAIKAYRETAPPATTGWCYEHLGWAAIIEGDLQAARAHFDEAATLAVADADGAWLLPHALAALAPVTAALGQPQQALTFADRALAAARRFALPSVVIMALSRAAETALLARSQRRAARLIAEMLGLVRDRADQAWLADGLEMAALALDSRGDMSAAVAILNASDALRSAAGERPGGARPLASKVDEARRRLLQVPQRKDNSEALLALSPVDATDYARAVLDELAGPPV